MTFPRANMLHVITSCWSSAQMQAAFQARLSGELLESTFTQLRLQMGRVGKGERQVLKDQGGWSGMRDMWVEAWTSGEPRAVTLPPGQSTGDWRRGEGLLLLPVGLKKAEVEVCGPSDANEVASGMP